MRACACLPVAAAAAVGEGEAEAEPLVLPVLLGVSPAAAALPTTSYLHTLTRTRPSLTVLATLSGPLPQGASVLVSHCIEVGNGGVFVAPE